MILHWLVGPHPWVRRHAKGFAWVGLLAGWLFFAWLMWGIFGFHWRDWGSVVPTPKNATDTLTGAAMGAFFVGVALVAGTGAALWDAEERRLRRDHDVAERIRRLEEEVGISP